MARAKRSLEDAIYNVSRQLDNITKQAAKDVARKLKEDMKEEAKKVVKHYYDSYRPDWHDRIWALYHSYGVFNDTKDNKVSVSIEFDPKLIQGEHKSDSKYHQTGDTWKKIDWPNEKPSGNNYGIPEADWILNNFWEGLHPVVTGNKYTGFTYWPVIDMKSPQELFEEFAHGSYINKVLIPYANEVLTNRILKALNQQFK